MGVAAVAIVKYDQTSDSLRRAIELADGFSGLKSTDKVLIKPNIALGMTPKVRPDGILTSTVIVEQLIGLLREYGCTDISIGEGPAIIPEVRKEWRSADWAFEWSDFRELAERVGVKLLDLNKGGKASFVPYSVEELEPTSGVDVELVRDRKFMVSKLVVEEADFFINVPVLKTHRQGVITLGLKNLKGCIYNDSKRASHVFGLHRAIAVLGKRIRNDLVIIDGTYGLERGPIPTTGRDLQRFDLVIVSKDILACDMVGSAIMGIDPKLVPQLQEFARMTGRSLDLNEVDVKGEKIENVSKKLEWEYKWSNQPSWHEIKGITFQDPGESVCTACGMTVYMAMERFFGENKGATFADVELCVGPGPAAKKDSKKVLLFGDCANIANKQRDDAIRLRGCPPTIEKAYQLLADNLVNVSG